MPGDKTAYSDCSIGPVAVAVSSICGFVPVKGTTVEVDLSCYVSAGRVQHATSVVLA